ncbi:hypothetical protein FHT70_001406 [Rhizobium sp. BK049]|uniref:hypothetical protein n=1 Tax=Rhizobium sp. BK049 TaxID=2587095 RepID=UPI0017DCBCD2|nr:hypothetical protein [Rhizobium sp. BK049]MBB3351489.1 hypothetical protein [Rhizobium sp. BK049]
MLASALPFARVVDEYNYDIVEHSWYIEPYHQVLGRFSKSFMMKIAAMFSKARSQSGGVKRFD